MKKQTEKESSELTIEEKLNSYIVLEEGQKLNFNEITVFPSLRKAEQSKIDGDSIKLGKYIKEHISELLPSMPDEFKKEELLENALKEHIKNLSYIPSEMLENGAIYLSALESENKYTVSEYLKFIEQVPEQYINSGFRNSLLDHARKSGLAADEVANIDKLFDPYLDKLTYKTNNNLLNVDIQFEKKLIPSDIFGIKIDEHEKERLAKGLYTNKLDGIDDDGELKAGKFKLRKDDDGEIRIDVFFQKEKLELPSHFGDYELTKEDHEKLKSGGMIESPDGYFLKIDIELNRLAVYTKKEMNIPKQIGNYVLTPEDTLTLANKGKMPQRLFYEDGIYFTASVAYEEHGMFRGIAFNNIQRIEPERAHQYEHLNKHNFHDKEAVQTSEVSFVEVAKSGNMEKLQEMKDSGYVPTNEEIKEIKESSVDSATKVAIATIIGKPKEDLLEEKKETKPSINPNLSRGKEKTVHNINKGIEKTEQVIGGLFQGLE